MTYQLALAGADGIVLASDQCERVASSDDKFGFKNMVRKISIDQTGRFAWAYSGSEAAPVFSKNISEAMKALGGEFSEDDAVAAFEEQALWLRKNTNLVRRGPGHGVYC